jgi:hypothetical protein
MIARGVAPIDVTSTLAQIAALRQRDQVIAEDQRRTKLLEDKFFQEQAAQFLKDQAWQAAAQSRDWLKMAELDPVRTREIRAQFDAQQGSGGPKLGTLSPGDWTAESLAKFQQTGNLSDLVRYVSPNRPRDESPVNLQRFSRPNDQGMMQDYIFDPRSGQSRPDGPAYRKPPEPRYDPVTGEWVDPPAYSPPAAAPPPAAPSDKPKQAPGSQGRGKPSDGLKRSMSKSGKPMVFRNGRWEYE